MTTASLAFRAIGVPLLCVTIPGTAQRAIGQGCAPGIAGGIAAPAAAQDGDTISYAFSVSVPNTGVECAALVAGLKLFPPSMPPDDPDTCSATNGISIELPCLRLDPGEFVIFRCEDSFVPNCSGECPSNCEVVVPEMCYLASEADLIGDIWEFQACVEIDPSPPGPNLSIAFEAFTSVVEPDISMETTSDTTVVCQDVETDVTFGYHLTTGEGNVAIGDIVVNDDQCGPVVRGPDAPGNNDNVLEIGEAWTFSCSMIISSKTMSTATVLGTDVVLGRTVSDFDVILIPTTCAQDLSCDLLVGPADLAALLAAWGPNEDHPADFNDSGVVGPEDLASLLAGWGQCRR